MNYVLDSSKAHHKYFEELCYIPHPPFQEKALSEYVIAFAKERGLWYYTDSLYNVVVKKARYPGLRKRSACHAAGPYGHGLRKDAGKGVSF